MQTKRDQVRRQMELISDETSKLNAVCRALKRGESWRIAMWIYQISKLGAFFKCVYLLCIGV